MGDVFFTRKYIKDEFAFLYNFTTATFTNGGQTRHTGPSLAQARNGLSGSEVNDWKNNTEFFNTNNGIQLWTVPEDGTYRILARGATAGNQIQSSAGVGNPAEMRGDFGLISGEIIKILVGQHGWEGSSRPGWGGGGGSFVAKNDNTPLIVAGGAGATHDGSGTQGLSWQKARTDTSSHTGGPGVTVFSSNPGFTAGSSLGGAGAGFLGNGTNGNGATYQLSSGVCSSPTVAQSFINGGNGSCVGGGFGGGGNVTNTYGGGGGGYTGGGGGGSAPYAGGGGGSFNSGTNQLNQNAYNDNTTTMANGLVTITKL